ncbi:hypothetical protein ACKC9G_12720 [Pokkaliibacter sp. CJK22405]|uniref:hypothetical protein n=1 Tax=Pokkaliibacter sp. CJK22405 TaxID=3384615 RepID=UPI003984D967
MRIGSPQIPVSHFNQVQQPEPLAIEDAPAEQHELAEFNHDEHQGAAGAAEPESAEHRQHKESMIRNELEMKQLIDQVKEQLQNAIGKENLPDELQQKLSDGINNITSMETMHQSIVELLKHEGMLEESDKGKGKQSLFESMRSSLGQLTHKMTSENTKKTVFGMVVAATLLKVAAWYGHQFVPPIAAGGGKIDDLKNDLFKAMIGWGIASIEYPLMTQAVHLAAKNKISMSYFKLLSVSLDLGASYGLDILRSKKMNLNETLAIFSLMSASLVMALPEKVQKKISGAVDNQWLHTMGNWVKNNRLMEAATEMFQRGQTPAAIEAAPAAEGEEQAEGAAPAGQPAADNEQQLARTKFTDKKAFYDFESSAFHLTKASAKLSALMDKESENIQALMTAGVSEQALATVSNEPDQLLQRLRGYPEQLDGENARLKENIQGLGFSGIKGYSPGASKGEQLFLYAGLAMFVGCIAIGAGLKYGAGNDTAASPVLGFAASIMKTNAWFLLSHVPNEHLLNVFDAVKDKLSSVTSSSTPSEETSDRALKLRNESKDNTAAFFIRYLVSYAIASGEYVPLIGSINAAEKSKDLTNMQQRVNLETSEYIGPNSIKFHMEGEKFTASHCLALALNVVSMALANIPQARVPLISSGNDKVNATQGFERRLLES